MSTTREASVMDVHEEIELIVEAGSPEDALNLMRRLARDGDTQLAVDVRRTVKNGTLDRLALRHVAYVARREHQRSVQEALRLFDLFAVAGAPTRGLTH